IWWLGRLLDGTDGIFARATQQTSLFGAFLDILSDMASYSIMVLGFSLAFPDQDFAWRIVLFLYVLCITGALSLGSLQEKRKLPPQDNRGLRLAAGLAEGGETGIAYSIFLILPQFISISGWIWIGFLIVTVISRCLLAYRELRE
ncbi:MAG: CDP-alcohol phosphatidyltransferase family protein, partial [Pseudobdellovibrionaceae bacterium]